MAARSLITGKTWTLGLVVPDLLHPFFAQVAKAISAEVRKKGYSLFISSSDEDPVFEMEEIEQLLARRVDVMLVASAQRSAKSFRRIEELKTPLILIDRHFAGLHANFVGVNDTLVGTLATAHLVEQRCRRIAHIRGPEVSTAIGRMEGYKQALADHRTAPLTGHIVSIGTSGDHRGERGGYEAAAKLLTNRVRPDGIFLRIPEDVAVVGCGNLSYSDFLRVPLTSVDQGSQAIGKRAARLAMSLTRNKTQFLPKCGLIPAQLVVRASSLRIPPPVRPK